MRPEDKATRVREIIDQIDFAWSAPDRHVAFTPGDLHVIREVLQSAEHKWLKQAKFREYSKLHRAVVRVALGPSGDTEGYERAKAFVEAHPEEAQRIRWTLGGGGE